MGKEAEEAKSLLQKREDDLNRIRQARDQLEAQLREATSKYESKWSCIEKYKALADTQGVSIRVEFIYRMSHSQFYRNK